MIELQIVTITTDPAKYPEYADDTVKHPDLVSYVEDEVETFVVDPRDGGFWGANEFFDCNPVTRILVDPAELE
jgi:hypothetical protein